MIVAIVNQTVPAGIVTVTAFIEAASAVAGRDAYINGFTPALPAADWLGVDTGWLSYQQPSSGMDYQWAYDFGTASIVEQLQPETARLSMIGITQVVEGPKADPSGGTTPFAWEDMGWLSVNLDFMYEDLSKAQFRVWGQHKTHQEGVNAPQLRLSAAGVAYSDELDLPDTAGAWQNFDINTIGYTLPGGRTLFVVQSKLRNALSTIELRAVSIAQMQKLL